MTVCSKPGHAGYAVRMARFVSILFAALLAGIATPCLAWSKLGHQLVAELAWRHLQPGTRAEIQRLLADEPTPTLAGIASWADELRHSDPARFKQTSKWHYINAKGGGCTFQMERDCPHDACAVGAIERQLHILADRDRPLPERRDALKFVVHLVGDLHQPMHAGDRDDAGGNRYQISLRTRLPPEAYARQHYADGVMGTNLHAVWDYYVLGEAERPLADYVDALDALPWPPAATAASSPIAWAEESCRLIQTHALYPRGHKLDGRYGETMRPLAEQRVRQAAWRLAERLDAALADPAPAEPAGSPPADVNRRR